MPQITPMTLAGELTQTAKTAMPSASLVQPAPAPVEQKVESENVPRETKPEPTEQDKKFAILARREKEMYHRDKDLKERERKMQEQYKPWQEAQELSQRSKVQAIQKLGISYDDLVAEQLGISNLTPEQMAERKASEIAEARIQEFETKLQQKEIANQQKIYTQALQQITHEVKEACDPEKFPLVNNLKGFDTITALIEQTFHQTGTMLSREEGLKQYEDFLEEEFGNLLKEEKIRLKLIKNEPQTQPAQQAPLQQTPIKTLTHKTTVAPTASLTPEEKRRRAVDIFYGR